MGWFSRESTDSKAERSLHEAIGKRRDNLGEINTLLRLNADVARSQLNTEGRTALHMAAIAGRVDVAEAVWNYRPDVNSRDKSGYTPLHVATDWTRVGMVEWLLQNKADPNLTDARGATPMLRLVMVSRRIAMMDLEQSVRQATDSQRQEFLALWFAYAEKILQLLVKHGADTQAGRPFSPLGFSMTTGEDKLAQLLRNVGAVK